MDKNLDNIREDIIRLVDKEDIHALADYLLYYMNEDSAISFDILEFALFCMLERENMKK